MAPAGPPESGREADPAREPSAKAGTYQAPRLRLRCLNVTQSGGCSHLTSHFKLANLRVLAFGAVQSGEGRETVLPVQDQKEQ